MKRILVILALLGASVSYAQTWTTLSSGTSELLRSVHFVTEDTGFVVGSGGVIIKTTDGGNNWQDMNTNYPGYMFWDVQFLTTDLGFVVGEGDSGMNPSGPGIILKTTDGGANWTSIYSNNSHPVRDLFVLDANTIYAAGGAENMSGALSALLKSTDGGNTWTELTNYFTGNGGSGVVYGGIHFNNADTGFLGRYDFGESAHWLSTSDGGSNLSNTTVSNSMAYGFFSSDFPSADTGYFTRSTYSGTDSVYLRKTVDGGASWSEAAISNFIGKITWVDFIDDNTGYISGGVETAPFVLGGIIMKTTDGGETWAQETIGNTEEMAAVHFPSSNIGYAVGANGAMIKKSIQIGIGEQDSDKAVLSVYPNPSTGVITINPEMAEGQIQIEVLEILGRTVRSTSISGSTNTSIDLSGLEKGHYLIRVSDSNQTISRGRVLLID